MRHILMLAWIDMHIIDMAGEIMVTSDRMLPVAALPNASLAFSAPGQTDRLLAGDASRKPLLDEHPAYGVVAISLRQGPDRMHVVWQDDPRDGREGMSVQGGAHCAS